MAILPIHSTVITPFGPKTNPLWPVGIYLFEGICKNPHVAADYRASPFIEPPLTVATAKPAVA